MFILRNRRVSSWALAGTLAFAVSPGLAAGRGQRRAETARRSSLLR